MKVISNNWKSKNDDQEIVANNSKCDIKPNNEYFLPNDYPSQLKGLTALPSSFVCKFWYNLTN